MEKPDQVVEVSSSFNKSKDNVELEMHKQTPVDNISYIEVKNNELSTTKNINPNESHFLLANPSERNKTDERIIQNNNEKKKESKCEADEFENLILDMEKGYLVDEAHFDGFGNDDLDDAETLNKVISVLKIVKR
jgi:hypothetical protein